jgi:hypothetical protein
MRTPTQEALGDVSLDRQLLQEIVAKNCEAGAAARPPAFLKSASRERTPGVKGRRVLSRESLLRSE